MLTQELEPRSPCPLRQGAAGCSAQHKAGLQRNPSGMVRGLVALGRGTFVSVLKDCFESGGQWVTVVCAGISVPWVTGFESMGTKFSSHFEVRRCLADGPLPLMTP